MSELMNTSRRNIRRELMVTVSALAVFTSVYDADQAKAGDDAGRPTLWIELGGQLEQVNGIGDPFVPPFVSEIIADGFTSPLKSQQALSKSFGGEGKASFQPENSDWIFSASVRFGRSQGSKSTHEQTNASHHIQVGSNTSYRTPNFFHSVAKFSETKVNNNEAYSILDFQAGKDIGLGLFGSASASTVNFGLRFAQFNSKQSVGINADPDFYVPYKLLEYNKYHHTYSVMSHIDRSFHGLGPSISWNVSAPLIRASDDSSITLNWGMNAAALFGRQTVRGHHQTVGAFYKTRYIAKYHFTSQIHRSGNPDRSRSVVVPNVGGFAGVSFVYANAKVSFGYRGDFFFGAMDTGFDTAKRSTIGFFGPFATVGIGLGG